MRAVYRLRHRAADTRGIDCGVSDTLSALRGLNFFRQEWNAQLKRSASRKPRSDSVRRSGVAIGVRPLLDRAALLWSFHHIKRLISSNHLPVYRQGVSEVAY